LLDIGRRILPAGPGSKPLAFGYRATFAAWTAKAL